MNYLMQKCINRAGLPANKEHDRHTIADILVQTAIYKYKQLKSVRGLD